MLSCREDCDLEYLDTKKLLERQVVSPLCVGPQAVDTVIAVPSLSPGKLVRTPIKEGEWLLILPWHVQGTLILSNASPLT